MFYYIAEGPAPFFGKVFGPQELFICPHAAFVFFDISAEVPPEGVFVFKFARDTA
jgi:hypothetical protein